MRAICLDVTRSVSRAGSGPATGIDRVERAYLEHLLNGEAELFGLCRLASGLVLLDREGLRALTASLDGVRPWGATDLAARLSRLPDTRRRAEAELRRLSVARSLRTIGTGRLVSRLPGRTLYLNVGHSNLSDVLMTALGRVRGITRAVMIHDTIPLDFPQYQRPGTVERFADKLGVTGRHADRVIAISEATAASVRHHLGEMGYHPETITAHLGVDMPRPVPSELPAGLPPDPPYFVALGTIEPRKNHAFLLDMWEEMAAGDAPCPTLVIAGRRGWNNAEVFDRLDRSPLRGHQLREHGDLSDGAVAALLQGANGLLFPSRAEGFGLPPVEAASLGTPVVASPLPVLREILQNIPIYADTSDMYLWIKIIRRLAGTGREAGKRAISGPVGIPTWHKHFKTVFTDLR